jgi:dihydroorotate dehydrogenase
MNNYLVLAAALAAAAAASLHAWQGKGLSHVTLTTFTPKH